MAVNRGIKQQRTQGTQTHYTKGDYRGMKKESKKSKSITERNSNDKSQDYYIKAGDTIYLHIDTYIPLSTEVSISTEDFNKIKLLIGAAIRTTFKTSIIDIEKNKFHDH